MSAPARIEGDSPFVIVKHARRIPATYKDSLMDPERRKALKGEGIFGHQDIAGTAHHLGLERLAGFLSNGGGEWEMYFGKVETPQLEGPGPIQSVGLGLHKGLHTPIDMRHIILGVSEDPEKTDRQFRTDLEQITKNLIERPLLARLMDSSASRVAAVYPVAAIASIAALEGVFIGSAYLSGINIEEASRIALSKEGAAVFGGIGLFLGSVPTSLINDQIQRHRDRSIVANVPSLGESFADKVASGKLFALKNVVDQQRVAVEAFGGLRSADNTITPAEFGVLYAWLKASKNGMTSLNQRQSELPPVTQQPEASLVSENIAKALRDLRQARGRLLKQHIPVTSE